jgi:hypothetical protein
VVSQRSCLLPTRTLLDSPKALLALGGLVGV